jgi:hypothetical protein
MQQPEEHPDASKIAVEAESDGKSRQAVGPAGISTAVNYVLMTHLVAKLGRLDDYRNEAHGVQLLDDVKEYTTQIKKVQKEIEDLENTLLFQARDAANAKSL